MPPIRLSEKVAKREQIARSAVYLLMAGLLFALPELILSMNKPTMPLVYARPLICVLVFGINYFYLIDKYFYRKSTRWKYVIINIILVALAIMLFTLPWHEYIIHHKPPHHPMHACKPPRFAPHGPEPHIMGMLQIMARDFVILTLSIGLSIASRLTYKLHKWDTMHKEIIARQKEMELSNLKSQLNPHFLFNTLNNIYSLIEISAPKAQSAVHELSKLLRYMLYDNPNGSFTVIEKEIDFISNYIELMKLRLTEKTKVSLKTDIADKSLEIAPMLFIPLVGNAFKHGVSPSKSTFIDINISTTSTTVVCTVTNSILPNEEKIKNTPSGIGLENLRRQLAILYPDCHTLITEIRDETYIANLTITLT